MIKRLPLKYRHDSLRGWFAYELYNQMLKNHNIWVITGDLGYKMFDFIKRDFPERFINVGAAEQAMIGVAIGLALQNKIPFVYSITPFLIYRPFETLRNYLHHESIPVRLVGSGRNKDYKHDGISHWAQEDKAVMSILNNIESKWPNTKEEISALVEKMVNESKPWYINLRR
ncbi:MAG: hypothetical protein Q7R77_01865 [Candidatus Daviesbacteria bacterium]|nr:hypothetical protein [Candidatus Daviesbacteria bacterium]